MRSSRTYRRVEATRRKLTQPENWTRLTAPDVATPLGTERGAWVASGSPFRLTMRVARADEVQELDSYQSITLYLASLPVGHALAEKDRVAAVARQAEQYEIVRIRRSPNGMARTLDYAIMRKI